MSPSRCVLSIALGSLVSLVLATPARATWPHDPSGGVDLCNAANEQRNPAAVSDGAGGAIVAWEDQRFTGNVNVFVQHVSATGIAQWGNLSTGLVVCNATGTQSEPVICSDGAGGAVIAWADLRSGTAALYAQRISSAGVAQWASNGVLVAGNLSSSPGTNGMYGIATDTQGGAYVAWATTANDVRMQRLSGAGAALFAATGVVLENTYAQQTNVSAAPDGSGGAIACWQGYKSGQNNDILAQRVNAAGSTLWPTNGQPVCGNSYDQELPVMTPDGGGGAYFQWTDYRSGTATAYAEHVVASGAIGWLPYDGILVSVTGDPILALGIAGDGLGGAYFEFVNQSFANGGLYVQHFNANALALFGSLGERLPASYIGSGTMIADGLGGVILEYVSGGGSGSYDIHAQRLLSSASLAWAYPDVVVNTSGSYKSLPALDDLILPLVADGSGGAIFAWEDTRNDAGDIYVQNVERFGKLGAPQPVVTKVSDVLADQGGQVSLQWAGSYLDAAPTFELADYSIWREAPAASAQAALRSGARLLAASDPRPAATAGTRLFRALPAASGTEYWEVLATVPARALGGYSRVVPTTTDSTGTSNLYSTFMVMAEDLGGNPFWASAPDSGYSVDNIPPVAPAPFTAAYASGATQLHWGANTEADLAGYRVYRGTSADFVPGSGNVIVAQPDTGYADVGPAGSYYKLSAVDIHGNESAFAAIGPSGTSGVGADAPRTLALADPAPNPARAQARLAFALPVAGPARLGLFDVTGRLVRRVREGWMEAGRYSLTIELRNGSEAPLAGGLYFARLDAEGRTLVRRLAVVP